MKPRRSLPFSLLALATLFALLVAGAPHLAAQGPPPGGPAAFPAAPPDSMAPARDSLMKLVMEKIAGRENAPAESVFKNIQVLKGLPAANAVRIMNYGFGRSLGVGCFFCHDRNDWAKDDKNHLKIAREMWKMTKTINDSLLAKIDLDKHGSDEKAVVNCGTCHRGSPSPGGRRPPRPGAMPSGGPPPGQR